LNDKDELNQEDFMYHLLDIHLLFLIFLIILKKKKYYYKIN